MYTLRGEQVPPLNPRVLFNKAETLRLLERDDEAKRLYKKARAIDPEFPGLEDALAALDR